MRKSAVVVILLALAGTGTGALISSMSNSAPSAGVGDTSIGSSSGGNLPVPDPPPGPSTTDPKKQIGTVEIPRLKVTQKLMYGVTLPTFDHGVGWWPGTAEPGQYGNMVLGGHRTTAPRPFRYLDKIKPGDQIIVTTDLGRFVYRARETKIVDDSSLWIVDQKPGYTATLFACHPVGSTAQRIVVFADLERPT